ncbi:MAG: aminotransferase class V-fold PLP-dependent enzyme [Clostridia bacterium]|nr:aminotransferase class V-fold PLP-dependent enzyme [Clostridia bacterium]
MRLYDILRQYTDKSVPYHMPGHKRNPSFDYISAVSGIDYTEIDGLDNLHAPEGIIRDAQDHAARVFGADRSFFLVNGTTGGILASVYALAKSGKPVIMARNCHKSVYNAVTICRSKPVYILPRPHPMGFAADITPSQAEEAILGCPDAACMLITSPTYDGVVSDVGGIAEVCHRYGVALIVDAAHGSHLGFLDPAVQSPVTCGADVTVMSLHKTMPSLTQTSILHVCGALVNPDDIAAALGIFETSSPSYLFLASVDGCAYEMENPSLFEAWRERIREVRESAAFDVPDGVFAFDTSKLILRRCGYTGDELASILRENGIEPEMTAENYVLLMTGAGDTPEMTRCLLDACGKIAPRDGESAGDSVHLPVPETVLAPWEASVKGWENVPLEDAAGRICAESVMAYPPGIPLLVPGERITAEMTAFLRSAKLNFLTFRGTFDGNLRCLPE